MNLKLQRYSDNGNSTLGLLFVDKKFQCHTLEDEYREIKVKGETRIPAGRYKLGINYEYTPLTEKYRKKFHWFENHIQIMNVPGFNSVYLHIGNTEENTDACILLGNSVNNNQIEKGFLGHSTPAFEKFYFNIFPLLKGDNEIYIDIVDEKGLFSNE